MRLLLTTLLFSTLISVSAGTLFATTELSLKTGGATLVVSDNAGGPVYAISLTNAGSGYTSAPLVTITGGGGTGATAKATINTTTHKITGITLLTGGTGYTSSPTVTITGGGGSGGNATANAAFDDSPETGVVTFGGPVGQWTVNVTTGLVGDFPTLDLSSVNTCGSSTIPCSGTGAKALTMSFTNTNLVGPVDYFTAAIGGTLATGHSLTFAAYEDDTNSLFGQQHQIGSTLTFAPPPTAFSGQTNGGAVSTGNFYSLTEVVTLSATRKGNSSFNASIQAEVPEAGAGPMLAVGLLLIGMSAWCRVRRKRGVLRSTGA